MPEQLIFHGSPMLQCTVTGAAEIPGMVTGRSCLGCARSGAKVHQRLVLKQRAETLRDTDRAEKKKSSSGFAFNDCLWQTPWRRSMDPQARLVLRNRPRMVQGWGTALQMSWHRCLGTRARAHFQGSTPNGQSRQGHLFWGTASLQDTKAGLE